MCGALEFSEKISKIGTQPIIGSQINFRIEKIIARLPIFAKTEEGYKNLTKLSSKSYLEVENNHPHCSISDLISMNDGLIVLSGGINDLFGELYKANKIKLIKDIYLSIIISGMS